MWKKKGCGQAGGVSGPPLLVLGEMEMQLEGRGEQLVKRQKVGLKELQELALTTSFSSSASPHG